ncbi:MAG TPA: hypothetical protein VHK44_05760 [Xanthobacteraceae bacterium]|nr:hypothetical protein [Xanthobacteraceae bacterium]
MGKQSVRCLNAIMAGTSPAMMKNAMSAGYALRAVPDASDKNAPGGLPVDRARANTAPADGSNPIDAAGSINDFLVHDDLFLHDHFVILIMTDLNHRRIDG